jgi:hypothetical protein
MMLETPLRQAATGLLKSAIRIAPPASREWGQAMRGELSYVEGHWAALMWAFGGASVMAKHALISLLIPGRRGQVITPDGGLFAKNVSLRKAVLVTAAGFILASLLFFAAPPFRQALRISLAGWNELFHVTAQSGQPRLRALARKAGARRDPEGLVFAAVRLSNDAESAQLAEEAVKLDPNLLWVYAIVAVRHPLLAEIRDWIPKLEHWDPQNALFLLIAAESCDIARAGKHFNLPYWDLQTEFEKDPAWRSAMGAAFASPKLDDYLDRLKELDRRVVRRYGFNDPDELLSGEERDLPSFAWYDSERFAKSILQSGQDLEGKGDRKGAVEKYWSVARFGQTIESRGHTDSERNLGLSLQAGAYKQLQKLAEKGGNANEAALFAYLAGRFEKSAWEGRWGLDEQGVFGQYVSRRNAAVLQISSLMMVVFSGLMVVAALMLIVGGRQGGRPGPPRARPVATLVALTSGIGLLLSSATVYLTYRPYWYIFDRAILNGDRSQTRDLSDFLMATRLLPGVARRSELLPNLPLYFWTGITLLGVIGLVLILLRHFRGRPSANGLQNHPRVP